MPRLPTAAIPLCDPLLTLVDVTVVGNCAGTACLAALGPNAQVFTFFQCGVLERGSRLGGRRGGAPPARPPTLCPTLFRPPPTPPPGTS